MKPAVKLIHVRNVESNKKKVPAIIISGVWLGKMGWQYGDTIRVVADEGGIQIKKEKI